MSIRNNRLTSASLESNGDRSPMGTFMSSTTQEGVTRSRSRRVGVRLTAKSACVCFFHVVDGRATEAGRQVITMYGPVPMKVAHLWPVITTYDDLSTYAVVKGGRIPTEPELRLFLDKFRCGYEGGSNVGFRNWHPVP